MPEGMIEEFAAQRAKMRALLENMKTEPRDGITMDGVVVVSGEPARIITESFVELCALNLHLMDLLVKGHFH